MSGPVLNGFVKSISHFKLTLLPSNPKAASILQSLQSCWTTLLYCFSTFFKLSSNLCISHHNFIFSPHNETVPFLSFLLQLMSAGVGQYPSLYSTPVHSESGKWDALVKASESLLKEKELIIERQVLLIVVLLLKQVSVFVCQTWGLCRL